MARYIVTAEHGNGQSVGHPCRNGIYPDPTDSFECRVEAGSETAAIMLATEELGRIVDKWGQCDCQRAECPGSNSWWESVAFMATEVAT